MQKKTSVSDTDIDIENKIASPSKRCFESAWLFKVLRMR
jgi:hypothetical protein